MSEFNSIINLWCYFSCRICAGEIFRQNFGSYTSHIAPSHPRRQHPSLLPSGKHQMLHWTKQRLVNYISTATDRHDNWDTVAIGSLHRLSWGTASLLMKGAQSFSPWRWMWHIPPKRRFCKNHTASPYPTGQHSSLLPQWKHPTLQAFILFIQFLRISS